MGYELSDTNIPAASQSIYTCPCCCGFPRYPAQLHSCGHIYCYICLMDVLNHTHLSVMRGITAAKCPTCREPFTNASITPFESFTKFEQRLFTSIDVTCSFHCGFVGTFKSTAEHEQKRCRLRILQCPNAPCTEIRSAEDMAKSHFFECQHRLVFCPKCGFATPPPDIEEHDCLQIAIRAVNRKFLLPFFCFAPNI